MNDLMASVGTGPRAASPPSPPPAATDVEQGGGGAVGFAEGPPAGSEDEEMERFYGVVSGVRAELKKLDAKLVTLRELNAQAGLAAAGIASAKAARDELSAEVESISKEAGKLKKMLDQLHQGAEKEEDGGAKSRIKQSVLLACQRKLKLLMQDFSELRNAMKEEYKEILGQRYETVHGERPSEEKLEKLMRTGRGNNLFKRAILEQGQGAVDLTVEEIGERRQSMLELEQNLDELHQVFLDFSALVADQGDLIDNIESQVAKSADYTASGAQALQQSKKLHKSIQKKKLIFGAIGGAIAFIIIIILIVSFK